MYEAAHFGDQLVRDIGDIEMRHAGVATIRAAGGPAHQFDAGEPFVAGEGEDLVESQIGQNGADETELHNLVRGPWH